ncbi:TetR/AcrR family transcriptional regulator [Streptomyces sp. H27-D2]|uniref:TetR/AcrR family transcriptional regulator n=1 Tax=Streptomyces sp. H27-D2 TaxID=3046304 RepID=UPI002DB99601|nr:helix-turn-helix domain-containing protein [Streptomyces sp. H27-D2]MEC4019013.1 helix-turn-helix domain-containing protein [Streptomyces sp. H27-D2]
MARMSAEERRESVIRAAITEFARGGYNGTSTEAIARRVGVSQPYLFRLFPSKQAIFLAASERCLLKTRKAMAEELEARPEASPMEAMAAAYMRLIDDRDMLLMQMQMYVAVASAEAAGDSEFGAAIRAGWADLWDQSKLAFGGDAAETTDFLACGMLINVLVALGFPEGHRVWSGLDMSELRVPR